MKLLTVLTFYLRTEFLVCILSLFEYDFCTWSALDFGNLLRDFGRQTAWGDN